MCLDHTPLPEYQLDIDPGRERVIALTGMLTKFGGSSRAGIDTTAALGDADHCARRRRHGRPLHRAYSV
jgi:hypothetical protein